MRFANSRSSQNEAKILLSKLKIIALTIKSKNRQKEILAKSARLFRKKGYAATSIRDIADEVGMKSASLYNHIKSKQEILQSLLLPIAKIYVTSIDQITENDLPAIKKLEQIIRDQITITIENPDAVSLVPDQWVFLENNEKKNNHGYDEYIQLRNHYEKSFIHIFQKAIDEGDLKSVHIEIACFSILSTLRRLYSWYARHRTINQAILEKELIMNLLGGLRR